jgi:hypothetical protein
MSERPVSGVPIRVLRNLALASLAVATIAFIVLPDRPRLALGALGGGGLSTFSFWAISGAVGTLTGVTERADGARVGRRALVKFFTRHAILAVAAYVLLVRLHLDAVGMLVGVTTVAAAVAYETARPR